MYGQFSLAGNRVAELHLATRVFQAEDHSEEQRDKEQERAREKRRKI